MAWRSISGEQGPRYVLGIETSCDDTGKLQKRRGIFGEQRELCSILLTTRKSSGAFMFDWLLDCWRCLGFFGFVIDRWID